jgi:hypothetical protein
MAESCFACSRLRSIVTPRSVEFIGKSALADIKDQQTSLEIAAFESESHLTRIEESCFAHSLLNDREVNKWLYQGSGRRIKKCFPKRWIYSWW